MFLAIEAAGHSQLIIDAHRSIVLQGSYQSCVNSLPPLHLQLLLTLTVFRILRIRMRTIYFPDRATPLPHGATDPPRA